MLSIVSGIVIAGAGAAGLWAALPNGGEVNPWVRKPFLDSLIPVGIVSMLALGIALIVAGFF